jgi:xanthine dehydrogenase accessory factor
MQEVLPELEALSRDERRVAMATLVATKGTTPKKEGAKMWVGEGGRVLGSVTIGGCVDAKVLAESEGVLASQSAKLIKLQMGDEDAWEIGLSCGGSVEVLVEPLSLRPAGPVVERYQRIAAELEQGRAACLVRLLSAQAPSLLLLEGGAREGTLGAPALDEAAAALAREQLARRSSATRTLSETSQEAFFEVHAPRPQLVLVGAGHVSQPIAALARTLGFRTTVIDARPRFANRERFPGADEIRVGIASEIVASLRLLPSSALVLTVHDYKVELPVLKAALATPVGYIGMLGNRRRGKGVLDLLREQGVEEQQLARVQVPIGLDLGGGTAEEIGLSVLAQIVAARNGRAGGSLKERAP